MRRRALVASLLAFGALAAAQSPPPADKSRPDPPSRNLGQDTPKDTLKLLAAAMRDGDADQMRRLIHTTNTAETRMVGAMTDMAKAMARLQKAAVKAYGEEGAKEVVGDTQATDAEGRARIDSAEVKVQGDTATVVMAEGENAPVSLKRVDGRWKIPMSELSKGADPAALDERLTELAEQAKLVRQIAEEIETGKFTGPAQAYDAWQSRAMQVVSRKPAKGPSGDGDRKPPPEKKREGTQSSARHD